MTEVTSVPAGEESEANLQVRARNLVRAYYNKLVERGEVDELPVTTKQVYIVWFAKVLGNWKALVGTTHSDGLYFEVTHNGETNETYVDYYEKKGQMVQGPTWLVEERRERAAMKEDILKAAEHAAMNLRHNYNYTVAQIAAEFGIAESTALCLLVK